MKECLHINSHTRNEDIIRTFLQSAFEAVPVCTFTSLISIRRINRSSRWHFREWCTKYRNNFRRAQYSCRRYCIGARLRATLQHLPTIARAHSNRQSLFLIFISFCSIPM